MCECLNGWRGQMAQAIKPYHRKPCLCVEPGESISELEAVPAIRRAHEGKK